MRAKWLFGAASAALLAGPALAQAPDAPSGATTQVRLHDSIEAEIGEAGDGDWYRLRVERDRRYRLQLDAIGVAEGETGLDPTLALYDSDGNQLAFNDDGPDSTNSALAYASTSAGEIFVEARGFLDESTGQYRLSVSSEELPAEDVANDAATRLRLTAGRDVNGAIDYEGDVDWYRLRTRQGRRYRINLDGGENEGALGDPLLRIVGADGVELAMNDDAEGLNSMLEYIPSRSGEVFVEASGFANMQTGAYTLRVAEEPLPPDTAAAAVNTRARLAVGQSVQSDVGYAGDSDWYRIRLSEGQSYRFSLVGDGDDALADPLLGLRDGAGDELVGDDDGGDGLNSYLEFTAPSTGDYYVEARGFGDAITGGYRLSAAAGDIPGDATTDATLSAEGDTREGMLAPAGDRDWFRVALSAGEGIRLSLTSMESPDALGDPMLAVYGPDGAELARDDDGGEGLNAWLEFQAQADGVYFVEARGFVEDAWGRYFLNLINGEIGASAENAEVLTPNSDGRTSVLGAADDVDWFSIELVEGRTYRFNLEGIDPEPLADPVLTLYNSEGEPVASDDDGGRGDNSYLTFAPVAGGVYYAAVSAPARADDADRYLLRVTDTDVPGGQATDELLDAASDERTSRIDIPGDLDSFYAELEEGVTYEIIVEGTGEHPLADPFLAVFDGANERVASDDDSGDGLDARLRFTPQAAGPYTLQASGLGGGVGDYKIRITRR